MTLYQILKVSPDASLDEIKRAFRKAAMKWHPDRNPDNLQEAERHFRAALNAYETLSDERRRAAYDAELRVMSDPQARDNAYERATRVLREAMYRVAVELHRQGYDENGMIEVMRGRGCPYPIAREVARLVCAQYDRRPSWFERLLPRDAAAYNHFMLYGTVGLIGLCTLVLFAAYLMHTVGPAGDAYHSLKAMTSRPAASRYVESKAAPVAPSGQVAPAVKDGFPSLRAALAERDVHIDEDGVVHYRVDVNDRLGPTIKTIRGVDGQVIQGRPILDRHFVSRGRAYRLLVVAGKPPISHTRCRPCGVPLAVGLLHYEGRQMRLAWWRSLLTTVGQFGDYPGPISLLRISDEDYALRIDDNGMRMGNYYAWSDLYQLTPADARPVGHIVVADSYGVPRFEGDIAIAQYEGRPVRAWLMKMTPVRSEPGAYYDLFLSGGGYRDDMRSLKLVAGPVEMLYRYVDGEYRLVSEKY